MCDWQAELAEPPGEDRDCPVCHAPTDREVLSASADDGTGKNVHAAALGRLGGLKGGPRRAEVLSAKRRREIARKAAEARWRK